MGALVAAVLAALLALIALPLATAGPAQATGYRYWSFWQLNGDEDRWEYATLGPALARPADGAVEGFRFAVSPDSRDATTPRGAHDFTAICGKAPAERGTKRIAVVIDFGTAADAPRGEAPPAPRTACARIPADATSADALAALAPPLRYDSNALLCAIAGYPRTGCGEQVSGAEKAGGGAARDAGAGRTNAPSDGRISSVGVAAGVCAVALLGAAAIWQARRRRG